MTTRRKFIRHLFDGGVATAFGPTSDVVPGRDGILRIPYLLEGDNIVYSLDGGPRKAPGTVRLNTGSMESGAVVKGLFDYWNIGTSGASAQHRIIHINTKIKKDDADGTFTDLFTGLETDKIPAYAVLEDLLVMASDSNTDVPKSWDGTTAQNLAGSPSNFAFVVEHNNRLWAGGVVAKPSRLYYSALGNGADWTGAGSGQIDISPSDGDVLTGLAAHKGDLWVFKGPYAGSIHRIQGTAPTGSDPFRRKNFIRGLGAVNHNSIFRFKDDLGYMWSDGSIHSLATTDRFGDYADAALSTPIQSWLLEHVNFARLKHSWATDASDAGYVLITLPVDSSTNNNMVLMMDFRFEPVRWAMWPAFKLGCVANVISSSQPLLMGGGNDGFVKKLQQPTRSIDGVTEIKYNALTPYLSYGSPIMMKTISIASLAISPKNNGNITFGWQRDEAAQQTKDIAQLTSGSSLLGSFLLGTSTLAGQSLSDRFVELEEGGEFRSIRYQLTNQVNNEDVEIHSLSVALSGGAWSTED